MISRTGNSSLLVCELPGNNYIVSDPKTPNTWSSSTNYENWADAAYTKSSLNSSTPSQWVTPGKVGGHSACCYNTSCRSWSQGNFGLDGFWVPLTGRLPPRAMYTDFITVKTLARLQPRPCRTLQVLSEAHWWGPNRLAQFHSIFAPRGNIMFNATNHASEVGYFTGLQNSMVWPWIDQTAHWNQAWVVTTGQGAQPVVTCKYVISVLQPWL